MMIKQNRLSSDPKFAELREELLEENKFLLKLVDTIPAEMYFDDEIKDKLMSDKHDAMDKVASALKRKSGGPELSAKAKHKRARLDPAQQKSVSKIQEELSHIKEKKPKKPKDFPTSSASIARAANIEELQKRLQEKIQALQAQRKAAANDPEKTRKLKNRVKKLKSRGSKMKAPVKNKVEKAPKKPKPDASSTKPVFNKEGTLIYSKFDFTEDGQPSKEENEFSGKKVKTLLKKAEKKKEKIENLKTVDPEKAKTVVEKEKWKAALLKSQGVKVKDDPTLLKKTLKREEKKKKRSEKAWKARKEDVEKSKKARQDKRARNIKMKKKEKFDKKIKFAKKKGRVIPGF